MSKRHNASRRRSYGRRRHELRERQDRGEMQAGPQAFELESWGAAAQSDPLAFLDPRRPRVRYAMGE